MNERSFIVKFFDKTGLIPGFLPRAHRVLAGIIPAGSKPAAIRPVKADLSNRALF
jgi:hypothetical protein